MDISTTLIKRYIKFWNIYWRYLKSVSVSSYPNLCGFILPWYPTFHDECRCSSDVDAYGFERGEDFDRTDYEEFFSGYLRVLARRASRWQGILEHREAIAKNSKCEYTVLHQ